MVWSVSYTRAHGSSRAPPRCTCAVAVYWSAPLCRLELSQLPALTTSCFVSVVVVFYQKACTGQVSLFVFVSSHGWWLPRCLQNGDIHSGSVILFFFFPIILSSFMSGNTSKKKNFPNQLFGFSEVFDLYRKGRINTWFFTFIPLFASFKISWFPDTLQREWMSCLGF